jgi:hypothetical protein
MYGIQIPHPSSEVDEVGSRLWKSLCHHEGALALLKLRQQHGPPPYLPLHRVVRRQVVSHYTAEHSTVSDIYLTTYLLQIRTYILRGIPIPDFLQNGAHYGEEGPALEFDSLMVRVAALRARSLALFSGKDAETCSDMHGSQAFAAETQNLDTALASWSQSLPEDWMFAIQTLPPNPDESDFTYNNIAHNYATHGHAAIWNRYRAIRLIVDSIRIRSLTHLIQTMEYQSQRSFVAIQQESIRTSMEAITNDLCGGVPFFFNSLDPTGLRSIKMGKYTITTDDEILPKMAGLLAWPLTVAISCEYIPEPQRQWLKGKLKLVAKSCGDAVLESVVEQGEFRF